MRGSGWMDRFYDAALALVYPQPCAVCGGSVEHRADGVACGPCWEATRVFHGRETVCWKCGAEARRGDGDGLAPAAIRCRRCEPDAFTAARAVGLYAGALRASVLALKHEPHVPARLKDLLTAAAERHPLNRATMILPVPLHPERRGERGFNQAEALARALAGQRKIPLDTASLARTLYHRGHRAGLDARGRRESVRGAFYVTRPRLIEGERLLLLDDVLTTGATVSACAAALREAGASEVFVLTIARA